MIPATNTQTPIEQILPTAIYIKLSPEGRRLYQAVYSSMDYRRTNRIMLSDEAVSKRSRISVWQLQAAKDEIEREGLMDVFPTGDRTCYAYRDPNES